MRRACEIISGMQQDMKFFHIIIINIMYQFSLLLIKWSSWLIMNAQASPNLNYYLHTLVFCWRVATRGAISLFMTQVVHVVTSALDGKESNEASVCTTIHESSSIIPMDNVEFGKCIHTIVHQLCGHKGVVMWRGSSFSLAISSFRFGVSMVV